jgi:hypothetical protein
MRLIHVQPPISFVPIRVHSWFKHRLHSCPFVFIRGSRRGLLFVPFRVFRGPIPPTTSPLRFIRENPCSSVARKTPLIRLIRGLEPRLPRGPSPLTPGPSPLSGARGAMWGCLGDLVLKPEQHWHVTYSCPAADLIRAHSCSFVVPKHRLLFVSIRGSEHGNPGALHPSPPAPLPFQGRGVPGGGVAVISC